MLKSMKNMRTLDIAQQIEKYSAGDVGVLGIFKVVLIWKFVPPGGTRGVHYTRHCVVKAKSNADATSLAVAHKLDASVCSHVFAKARPIFLESRGSFVETVDPRRCKGGMWDGHNAADFFLMV